MRKKKREYVYKTYLMGGIHPRERFNHPKVLKSDLYFSLDYVVKIKMAPFMKNLVLWLLPKCFLMILVTTDVA